MTQTKRQICPECFRPKSVCFCNEIIQQANKVQLIILQHPDEESHPLGTAQMAKLTFKNSYKISGTDFKENKYLNRTLNDKYCAILYPDEDAIEISSSPGPSKPSILTKVEVLIVLDGTWRKAKRILQYNETLRKLPKLKLSSELSSIYKIRKAPKQNFLSTLESSIYALSVLDQKDYSNSIKVLECQVEKHIKKMGFKYNKYY